MKVNVIRHLAFEDLGSFAGILKERDASVVYFEAGRDELPVEELLASDLLVILGGPISVNEVAEYPFLQVEIDLLKQRMAADRPTLGICLGAQLMAKALGSRIVCGEQKEIGWYDLQVSEAGSAVGMQWLGEENTRMLHWHGETFDLPDSATLLASSKLFQNQAFSVGKRALGLQFHPEVTASGLEQWYIGHTGEIHQTDGISVSQLRSDSERYAAVLEQNASHFFRRWLDTVLMA
ncbi:MAG: glutamine amidotransferase [Proteobacteria bacterium]|nr:glutamine amidotransferase [Pseudomonadota bacterium]